MLDQNLLAEILSERKIIDSQQLSLLQAKSKKTKIPLEEIILESGIVSEEELTKLKGELLSVSYVDLVGQLIPKEILSIIPREISENYKLVAFDKTDNVLSVALVEPQNFKAIEAIDFLTKKEGLEAKYFIISPTQFKAAIKQYETLPEEVKEVLARVERPETAIKKKKVAKELAEAEEVIKSAPVSKIVLVLIKHAIDGRASDIHIEPEAKSTRVRYRVDGILHTTIILPKYVHSAIVARIKVLSNLKLDETRKPQDGRIRLNIDNQDIDFRISTLPLFEGEKVVMRILKTGKKVPTLNELGFNPVYVKIIEAAVKRPHGTILLTGPTGSGKTSTLYTILSMLNKEGVNIITLEDPIEYYIDGINQSQINPEVGYTFASGLRSILRQDPNIIMLGEIRDEESAKLVIHAALTGHKVLSTLHTNDSIGAVPRLLDMGVEAFLLGTTLNSVIAQRLARKICPDCKEEAKVPTEILSKIEQEIAAIPDIYKHGLKIEKPLKFLIGRGCARCGNLGYKGRLAVAEAVDFTPELQELVSQGFNSKAVIKELTRQNFITLRQDGLLKAIQGLTTLEEVFRVTQL